jgi:hypothetical protein
MQTQHANRCKGRGHANTVCVPPPLVVPWPQPGPVAAPACARPWVRPCSPRVPDGGTLSPFYVGGKHRPASPCKRGTRGGEQRYVPPSLAPRPRSLEKDSGCGTPLRPPPPFMHGPDPSFTGPGVCVHPRQLARKGEGARRRVGGGGWCSPDGRYSLCSVPLASSRGAEREEGGWGCVCMPSLCRRVAHACALPLTAPLVRPCSPRVPDGGTLSPFYGGGSRHPASACKRGPRGGARKVRSPPTPLYPLTPAHSNRIWVRGSPLSSAPFMHGRDPPFTGSEGRPGATPSPSVPLIRASGAPERGPPPPFSAPPPPPFMR